MNRDFFQLVIITFIIALAGIFLIIEATSNSSDYYCPIIHEDGTRENVLCWLLPNCTEIGCVRCHYSCGRPGCDCREGAENLGHCSGG